MNNTVVVYKSKYGSTKKYAEWIAEELGCDLFEATKIKADSLKKYSTIIYGGGLYAGGVSGVSLITKSFDELKEKNIVVFTVGLADPRIEEQFKPIIDKNFTDEMKKHIKIFHLRGGIDYKKLGFIHKTMMAMLKNMVSKKEESQLTDEDRAMLETYGDVVDFTDIKAIEPIISFVKNC